MINVDEAAIQAYLYDHVLPIAWQIQTPQFGFSFGKRFIGISADQKVFVKLDEDYRILQLLSDAHLTPRYLAGGYLGERWITVQEFVEAWHPDRTWFATNITTWASLMQALQRLTDLRRYLPAVADESYRALLERYIQEIDQLYRTTALNADVRRQIEELLERYATRIPLVTGSGLVPTHGDPNRNNLLITPAQVYLIDWDSLHLSDPMRDVAQVLWWYYPKGEWPAMCDQFGVDLTVPQQAERLYLYISTRALYVSLFFHQIQEERWAQRFLKDAQQALAHQSPDELLPS